jgi:hypothetical protein
MKISKYVWLIGLVITLLVIIIPIIIFFPKDTQAAQDPWANVPKRSQPTSHKDIVKGPFESGQDVTRACLECHQEAAFEVMQTVHWTWESKPYEIEGRPEPVTIGKKNALNNFCIGIQSNWPGCTSCHAGYGLSLIHI